MSEEIQVKTVQNNGDKSRWGLSSFMYKTEGKKQSLNTKLIISVVGIFIVLSTGYSLISAFFNPSIIGNETIGLKNISENQNENSEIVNMNDLNNQNTGLKNKTSKVTKKLMGAQIITRENKVQVPGGTIIKAQILTQTAQGLVRAILTEPIIVQGEEIIASGSTISGPSQSTDDRLQVRFTKILDKSGKTYPIQAMACDESDQALGLKGKKSTRAAWLMATGTGLSVLSQTSQLLNSNTGSNSTAEEQLKKSAVNEASRATLEQSQNLLSDFKNQKSMIQVDSGTAIYILFEGE